MPQQPRPALQGPGGLAAVTPVGGSISGFARVSPQRVQGNEVVDFSALGNELVRFLGNEAEHRSQQEVARGQRFAVDNQGLADEVDTAVRQAASEAGSEEEGFNAVNDTFMRLVASGAVPEAANPVWQLGYIEQRGRNAAQQVRGALLDKDTFDAFTALSDDGDNPVVPEDLDSFMSQAFAEKIEGTALEASTFGLQAYTAAQEGIQNEVRERVRQVRLQRITEDRRQRFRDTLGTNLVAMEFDDFDQASEHATEISRVLEEDGRQRGISASAARGELLNALRDRAHNVALEDPARALALVRRTGAVEQNGVRLDHPGTESSMVLNDLANQMENQASEKQTRDLRLRGVRANAAVEFASGWMRDSALEALKEGSESSAAVDIAVNRLLGDDPDVERPEELTTAILGLGEGVEMPKDIRGHILAESTKLKRALSQDALDPAREAAFLNNLEIARITESLPPDTFITRAWEGVLDGSISFAAYNGLRQEADRLGSLMSFKSEPGSAYSTQVGAALDPGRIPPGLPILVRQALNQERILGFRQIDSVLQATVNASSGDEIDQRRAFNDGLSDTGVQQVVSGFTAKIQEAAQNYHESIRDVQTSINGFDFASALTKIDKARGVMFSGDDAANLRQAVESARKRQSDLIFAGPVYRGAELSVRSQAIAILQASESALPLGEVDRVADELVANFEVEYGTQAKNMLQSGEVSPELYAERLRAISHGAVDKVMEPFRTKSLAAQPEDTAGIERAIRATTARQLAAKQIYTGDAGRTGFFYEAQNGLNIDPALFERVEDIGYNPWGPVGVEGHKNGIIAEWNRAIFNVPAGDRAQAFVATHGQYRIPWADVVAGKTTVSLRGGGGKNGTWTKTIPELREFFTTTITGAGDMGAFNAKDQEAVMALFTARGIPATAVPVAAFGEDKRFMVVAAESLDLTTAPLSGFVTRYFEDIAEFDALPDADKKAGLKRFGFDVSDATALKRSIDAFRDDQTATIQDWKSKE